MASNELIIDDEYCKAMGSYFKKQGEEIDELISEYLDVLQNVKNKAIVSGAVSDALLVYLVYVEKLTKYLDNVSELFRYSAEKIYSDAVIELRFIFEGSKEISFRLH